MLHQILENVKNFSLNIDSYPENKPFEILCLLIFCPYYAKIFILFTYLIIVFVMIIICYETSVVLEIYEKVSFPPILTIKTMKSNMIRDTT